MSAIDDHWVEEYRAMLPYMFSIHTPEGSGSGFFLVRNSSAAIIGIATAAHVVQHADTWKLPIRLKHHESGNEIFLSHDDRVIDIDVSRDSACLVLSRHMFIAASIDLPEYALPMVESGKYIPIGNKVAWLGYPGIALPKLCLFTGMLSAFDHQTDSYLIDGVAINGVSGGPVFFRSKEVANEIRLPLVIGTVSAYMPNRYRGESLPGMASAQDITPFYNIVNSLRTFDEARARKLEEEAAAAAGLQDGATPSQATSPKVSNANQESEQGHSTAPNR